MPESHRILADYCDNLFFRSKGSSSLLVFLPSVNGKGVYPYYPRQSWALELVDRYNVLYVSDPYQLLPQYRNVGGSWFISPDGRSTIDELARRMVAIKGDMDVGDIIFYGSSMGGYAAVVLSALVGGKAVAECPQIYLRKHPGSRFVCENVLSADIPVETVEPLWYLRHGRALHVRLVCSVYDPHYSLHVLPFVEDVKRVSEDVVGGVMLNAYMSTDYGKGHVALKKNDALRVIEDVAGLAVMD